MSAPNAVESYESLYSQLQLLVTRLEQGELPLAEALTLYEQGVRLAAECQRLLDSAELRVQQLQLGAPETELED